jgi:putative ABC transport system substrate-binding protein
MVNRRRFLRTVSMSFLAAPLVAGAQQVGKVPRIGYLSSRSPGDSAHIIAAFRQGLKDGGFVEGHNVAIEYRFAEGYSDRLPSLAGELVRQPVNVVVATGGTSSSVAAKPVVPATIPMVFAMGGDPVRLGIVPSLARPGGNITGVSFLVNGLAAKQLQLLRELTPKAGIIGFLVNPNDPNFMPDTRDAQNAADALGHKLAVVDAGTVGDFDRAFRTLVQQRVGALLVQVGPFFADQRTTIAALAAQHRLPAIYGLREFVDDGGLMSYGTSITAANRQLGLYAARVLKGTKPADLPVIQSTTFEFVINMKTAKALELTIPPSLLGRADQVIE